MNKVQQGVELIDSMDDDELNRLVDYIRASYKNRRSERNAKARAELAPNDRVMITGQTKPKYLSGMTATVVALRDVRVEIKLDRPAGKFRNGIVYCSPGILKKIG